MSAMPAVEPPAPRPTSRAPLRLALPAWCALIFLLSSRPHLGTDLGTLDIVLRKCAHVTEYAVLALLAVLALRQEVLRAARAIPSGWIFAVAYAATDEFHQTFVRG